MKTIIQIGIANAEDHVKDFILKYPNDYFIYLIEPIMESNSLIEEAYSFTNNKIIFNIAISNTNGYLDLFANRQRGGDNAHCSVNYNHLIIHGNPEQHIYKINVPCLDLNTLINYIIQNKEIEYLFIDTEGHDCDILLSTDFLNFNIKNIIFEHTHTDGPFTKGEKYEKTKQHLKSFGYNENTKSEFNCCGNVCFTR